MKKIIALLSVVALLATGGFAAFADNGTSSYVYSYEGKTVEIFIEDDCGLSEEGKQALADRLFALQTGGVATNSAESSVQPRAWCWLTGHDKVTHTTMTLTHMDREKDPRCTKTFHECTYCTKCSYSTEEVIDIQYVSCCDEE